MKRIFLLAAATGSGHLRASQVDKQLAAYCPT